MADDLRGAAFAYTTDNGKTWQAVEFAESRDSYGRELRAAVRGLWTGALSVGDFTDSMEGNIQRGLTQAWRQGAEAMGVAPDELSQKELDALADVIDSEYGYITGFADAIEAGSKGNGGLIAPLIARSELWLNRYDETVARAMTMAGGDSKLEWVLGNSEHCNSCLRLSGKVKRASDWESYGILPKSKELECGGWKCACELRKTDKAISRGPLPAL